MSSEYTITIQGDDVLKRLTVEVAWIGNGDKAVCTTADEMIRHLEKYLGKHPAAHSL